MQVAASYNDIPLIENALFNINEEILKKIGEIFIKYQVEYIYNLWRIHRHFTLNSNEIMVKTKNESKPYDKNIIKENINIKPYCFKLEEDGAKGIEYASDLNIERNFKFENELYNMLKSFGLHNNVGILFHDKNYTTYVETSYDNRTSVLNNEDINNITADYVTTTWLFYKDKNQNLVIVNGRGCRIVSSGGQGKPGQPIHRCVKK